jgi:hypothetical protein
MISSIRRPIPDNTQQIKDPNIPDPVGFDPIIPARRRTQTDALDRAAIRMKIKILKDL